METKDITEKILADFNDVFADIVNGVLFTGNRLFLSINLKMSKTKASTNSITGFMSRNGICRNAGFLTKYVLHCTDWNTKPAPNHTCQ